MELVAYSCSLSFAMTVLGDDVIKPAFCNCCALQAQESIGQSRPEAAQARGRALLNLRMQDAEGGLLGRTLLTLVSNKVRSLCLRTPNPNFSPELL